MSTVHTLPKVHGHKICTGFIMFIFQTFRSLSAMQKRMYILPVTFCVKVNQIQSQLRVIIDFVSLLHYLELDLCHNKETQESEWDGTKQNNNCVLLFLKLNQSQNTKKTFFCVCFSSKPKTCFFGGENKIILKLKFQILISAFVLYCKRKLYTNFQKKY